MVIIVHLKVPFVICSKRKVRDIQTLQRKVLERWNQGGPEGSVWLPIQSETCTDLFWKATLVKFCSRNMKFYPGCQRLSCAVSGFGQVLKSDPLRRSCLRPSADETKLPDAREEKPVVPRVMKFRSKRGKSRRQIAYGKEAKWYLH